MEEGLPGAGRGQGVVVDGEPVSDGDMVSSWEDEQFWRRTGVMAAHKIVLTATEPYTEKWSKWQIPRFLYLNFYKMRDARFSLTALKLSPHPCSEGSASRMPFPSRFTDSRYMRHSGTSAL